MLKSRNISPGNTSRSKYETRLPLEPGSRTQNGASIGNPKQWSPDVNMLLSTSRWLELFGLKKYKLELKQILSSVGFKHSEEYVKALQKPVPASYSKGLFPQYACEDGTKYNLVDSSEKLKEVEFQLQRIIEFYKERLDWLTTSSRLMFGVIQEQSVTIVVDVQSASEAEQDLVKYALFSLVKEQLIYLSKFNFFRCGKYPLRWQRSAVIVSQGSIEDVLDWIYEFPTFEQPHDATCTIEALNEAAEDDEIKSIYLCTDGACFDEANELLRKNLEKLMTPVHIVAMNCKSPSALHFLRETVKLNKRRFHKFSLYGNDCPSVRGSMVDGVNGFSSLSIVDRSKVKAKLDVGKRQDVIDMWEEMDRARANMAEVKAIQLYISRQKLALTNPPEQDEKHEPPEEKPRSEIYMGSKEWLKKHSLHSKKLGFYDLLQSMAFKHCDGVIEVPNLHGDGTIVSVESKLVDAKYCEKFAHVRWKDGEIRHVHVSAEVHRNYERRVTASLESFKKRIQWLRKGSRELFGTIIEDQITILIDTSASMNSRLFLVKDKLYQLLQEQIKHKRKFNLIKFDSQAMAWKSRLVDCTERNIQEAWLWIKGLAVGGSTNTLAALKLALSDELCDAVYLLTDGRPDQPTSTILAQIHLRDPIPIHTISFNCSDESANEFLCKLSDLTNARFHYFSENGSHAGEVKVYESEDIRLIREEIEQGTRDLERLTRLRDWCAKLDWVGSNVKKRNIATSTNKITRTQLARPSSAPLLGKSNEPSPTPSRPRITRKKKKPAKIASSVEDKAASNSDSSTSSDDNRTAKCESNAKDDERTLIIKSTKELEDEIKKAMPEKDKIKKEKKVKRRIVPHSCGIKDDLDLTRFTKTSPTQRKMSSPKKVPKSPQECKSQWIRNHKVLARNNVDGFYYPGVLRVNINPRYADVSFCDVESQVVSLRHIIPIEGSRPCPSLKVGDYVLVKLIREGRPSCYVPGVVYVVPLRQSKATKYFTIIHYNGTKATALRKDIVKISQIHHAFACRYIKDCEITANKSSAITVSNSKKDQDNNRQEEYDSKENSNSSEDDVKYLREILDSDSFDESDNRCNKNNEKRNKNKKDQDSDSSFELDANNVDAKKLPHPSATNDELERIKQALLETRESQIKSFEEQQQRFENLQQQVKEAMAEQTQRQEELKRQYEKTLENRGMLDDEGNKMDDEELKEAKRMLEEKQNDIINDFKKHKELLEQLLKQQQANVRGKQSGNKSENAKAPTGSRRKKDDNSPKPLQPEQPEQVPIKQQEVDAPSKIQFRVKSGNKEACLWTKGSHGLLISRAPLDEDPAVENRPVRTPLRNGEEVLARWSDDGWYYRGTIREAAGEKYLIEDSVGNMEEISRDNIISDKDDAANSIKVNDGVIALHPSFPFSYAPGVVVNIDNDMQFHVRFYDGREDVIPREEVYYLSHEKFSANVDFIVRCEESLIGQPVVARNDGDGLFYLGHVRDRVGNGRQYVVEWPDRTTQIQSSSLIFGAHTKRHQLAIGDRVLGLSDDAQGVYEPGWITGVKGKKLCVQFSRKKRPSHVDPLQCFWLSSDYYDRTVDYMTQTNNGKTQFTR